LEGSTWVYSEAGIHYLILFQNERVYVDGELVPDVTARWEHPRTLIVKGSAEGTGLVNIVCAAMWLAVDETSYVLLRRD
jgi:hypothetical protein